MRQIYFDHNATTPIHPEVLDAMQTFMKGKFGNPSSVHFFGREARLAIDVARETIAELISAKPEEIIFTSGGTEADNLAIKGVCESLSKKGKHIITSQVEHHAVYNTCKHLEKNGFRVTYLPTDKYGMVDVESLKKSLSPETILISVMHANNEVGTIEPVEEIGKLLKEKSIAFHSDGVQALGKLEVNMNELNVDLYSMSAHKINGPKGVGALFVRKGTRLTPQIHGGHHERNRRAGTENVAGIAGFGKSVEIAKRDFNVEMEKVKKLRDRLEEKMLTNIEYTYLNGHPVKRLYNTLNISFEFIEGESLILNLDMEGVGVSTGSACTSGSLEPSHVLTAMGMRPELGHGSVRFSLGRGNSEEEVDFVCGILPKIVQKLRAMSPLYDDSIIKGGRQTT